MENNNNSAETDNPCILDERTARVLVDALWHLIICKNYQDAENPDLEAPGALAHQQIAEDFWRSDFSEAIQHLDEIITRYGAHTETGREFIAGDITRKPVAPLPPLS